ncbi:hypothetical protein ACHAXS_001427, partial [Conticribra weissflogii]
MMRNDVLDAIDDDVKRKQYDVIDMSNPNMSRRDRSDLIDKVFTALALESASSRRRKEITSPITKAAAAAATRRTATSDDKEVPSSESDPVLLYHSESRRAEPRPRSDGNRKNENTIDLHHSIHCVHFGRRIAIGPAGTRGSPSRTLRRTNRGILK